MVIRRLNSTVAAALALAPIAVLVVGCSRPPEQQLLTQFFRAAKARDNATTALMSAVSLNPREQGTVESFTIVTIGQEQRTPLSFRALLDAEEKAKIAEAEFLKTKVEYQNANIKTIEQVIKLERDPKAKMTPAQQKVKAEWNTWREGIGSYQKAVSAARAAVMASTGPAEASLTQPGQPALNPKTFDGETITKDVVVSAKMKTPDGADVDKTLTITFARVAGTLGGAKREGRPVITKITGL
jgi:hypothetical protein